MVLLICKIRSSDDQKDLWCLVWFFMISSILGDFMWISWIPRGSGAPVLMTGSAGTAMDVLVTCFSKKGGGSGRRGWKNRAGSGVR